MTFKDVIESNHLIYNAIPILVPGHGGIHNGKYQTPNKKYIHEDGTTIFEGVYNREIKNLIVAHLQNLGIRYIDLIDIEEDMPLKERIEKAKKIYKIAAKSFWIENHLNAGKGTGFEVYTSKGLTKSDYMATILAHNFNIYFSDAKIRADWNDDDVDKEINFFTIRNVPQPAILGETFFMDREKDAKLLIRPQTKINIAKAYVSTIVNIINNYDNLKIYANSLNFRSLR